MHEILTTLLNENSGTRTNGRVASDRTRTAYGEVLRMAFDQLTALGHRIQNPRNLNEEHIGALCQFWYLEGRRVSTIQEYLSKLRVFAAWIGKDKMVKSLPKYLPDVEKKLLVVSRTAKESKSWSENGIDIRLKIDEADALDWRFGLMVRMMLAFGLRRKEVTHNRPWKADKGDKLVIFHGEAKGGRPRDIYIDSPQQRAVLDFVKSKVKSHEYLGWPTDTRGLKASLAYCIGRYNKSMAKIGITKLEVGVTGHGLRAQYAENAALIAQMIPPTLGGKRGQMDSVTLDIKREQVSELLGHSRKSITNAYYGSFGRGGGDSAGASLGNIIRAALNLLEVDAMKPVPSDRIPVVLQLLEELTAAGVDASPRELQVLWHMHSQRFASAWATPTAENIAALEAAALRLIRDADASVTG
jgi:integrase